MLVRVLDGDLGRNVRGARVHVGARAGVSDRRGLARVRLRHRGAYLVTARARGFESRTVRIQFVNHPKAAIRIYRRKLQWPVYGGGPARTQTQPNLRVRPPFNIVWSRPMGGLLEFPAVVDQGVAFVGNAWGSVRAVRMTNGAAVWRRDLPGGHLAASPAVVGDDIVVHGLDGHVWVLDRYNGRVRWYLTIGSPIESSPNVWHGIDFFGAWNGNVYALDLRRRAIRWVHHAGYKITSSPARLGGALFIGDYGGRLWALAATSGRVLWHVSVNGRIYGSPAIAAGRIFVPSSEGGSVTAFSLRGRYLWRVSAGAYVYSSPAVAAGRVFFGSHNRSLYCVSAATGAVLWRYASGAAIGGSPAVVAGIVYVATLRNGIHALDVRNGRLRFRFPDGQYVAVSGSGARLLLHGYSRLYAVAHRR